MRAALILLVAIPLVAGGCGRHDTKPTHLVITYGVGQPGRRPADVRGRCPTGASCRIARWRGVSARQWYLRATERLRCDPPGGSYPEPARACAALQTYVDQTQDRDTACACAAPLVPPGEARGVLDGRRTTFGVDSCSACNLPKALRALAILTPGAG